MNSKNRGFTFLELMIVVSIVAILGAISFPEYYRFQAKSKRSEGILLLQSMQRAELDYYLNFDTFRIYNSTDQTLEIYGFIPKETLHFYTSRYIVFDTNQAKSGFVAYTQGNIDKDATADVLTLKYQDPGPTFNAIPDGITVWVNDLHN